MASLAVVKASLTGGVLAFVAATAGGDTFVNNGVTTLVVKNGDASPHTVTVTATKACDQGTIHNSVVAVAAGAEVQIGPFSIDRFGRAPAVTYSAVTSMTVAVVTD